MFEEIEPSSFVGEAFDVSDDNKLEIDKNDFIEKLIASIILKQNSIYTVESTDEFAFYYNGYYKCGQQAEIMIREWTTYIGNRIELTSYNSRTNTINSVPYKMNSTKRKEIAEQIRTQSFVKENDFDTKDNRICLLNGHIIIEDMIVTVPNPRTIEDGGYYDSTVDTVIRETVPFYFKPHSKYNENPYKTFFQLPIKYDPKATCPNIEEFLKTVVDEETVSFIYEMLGYFLFPTIKYQKAFILYGPPSSGKTTFIENLIYKFIGGAYWETVISSIKLHELSERFMLTELRGKRLNVWDDLKDDILTATDGFRAAVTNSFLRGKIKHVQEQSHWRNVCKVLYTCNDLPEMKKDPNEQFWRRWILVDFFSLFTDNKLNKEGRIFKKDTNIEAKISTPEEFSGLLNKCIEGFIRLRKRGAFENKWNDPEYIKGLWLININPVKLFVDECCEIGEKYETDYETFHKELNKFRKSKNVASITPTMMTRSMKALEITGFNANKKISKKHHPESCGRSYVGIKLKGSMIDVDELTVSNLNEYQ